MSISNHILSDIFILSVFESESGHKYENKYDISDIRPYPIRFHAYLLATWWLEWIHGGSAVSLSFAQVGKATPPASMQLRMQ
jgi:hypothetical protein